MLFSHWHLNQPIQQDLVTHSLRITERLYSAMWQRKMDYDMETLSVSGVKVLCEKQLIWIASIITL